MKDGSEALAYCGGARRTRRETSDLILLDLNLPRKVAGNLAEIKAMNN